MATARATAGRCLYRRSDFVIIRWVNGVLVVEDCNRLHSTRASPELLELLGALTAWTAAEDLSGQVLDALGGASRVAELLTNLAALGLVWTTRDEPSPTRPQWDPLDLAIQRRTATGGYRPAAVGRTGEPAPPAFNLRRRGQRIPLSRHVPVEGSVQDALDRRRSTRRYASRSLLLDEVAAVLYHSARVQTVRYDTRVGELVFRPYASAGARSELEIYLVVNDVEEMEPGAYYYDARAHDLAAIRSRDTSHERLNREVADATGGALNREPPVILVVTAVFERMFWKYANLGLSLIYKDVGCLIENLYLVATCMGLAPCAVGGGNESQNALWLGCDPLKEAQVGCFLLGPTGP